jgi:hypothetical protein
MWILCLLLSAGGQVLRWDSRIGLISLVYFQTVVLTPIRAY